MDKEVKALTPQTIFIGKKVSKEIDELVEEKLFTIQKGSGNEIKFITLTDEEMRRATALRIKLKQDSEIQEFLTNENKKADARGLAERLRVEIEKEYGNADTVLTKMGLKRITSLSWKKFQSAMDTLELFGHVENHGNNEAFQIIVNAEGMEDASLNRVNEAMEKLAEAIRISDTTITNKSLKRKLSSLLKKVESEIVK